MAMIKDKAIRELTPKRSRTSVRDSMLPRLSPVNSPLTTTQLGQTLFPHLTQSDLDFKTLCNVLVFWDLELGKVPR